MDAARLAEQTWSETGARVLTALAQARLSASPAAFSLYHAALIEGDAELQCELNALTASGSLSDGAIQTLWLQRLSSGAMPMPMGPAVATRLEAVVELLRLALGANHAYADVLNGLSGDIRQTSEPGAIEQLIGQLLKATEDARAANSMLEQRLSATRLEVEELRRELAVTQQEASQDGLTGLSNRKHFELRIREEMSRSASTGKPLALLMFDIDNFKQFNDRHGHLIGDRVLRVVAETTRQRFPNTATLARFGGEEFAVILPDTDLDGGWVAAESLRQMVLSRELVKRSTGERIGRISVSVGVGKARRTDTSSSLVARTDAALLQAKAQGRNCTVTEDNLPKYAVA
jgi:diguanylate cyclase